MEWLTLFAIFFGRIAAVQAKMWIQRETEKRNRKLEIFKTLMRTRGNPLSPEHVFALNTIILEFPCKTEPDTIIRKKWDAYLNQLNSPYPTPDQGKAVELAFVATRTKYLIDLLLVISNSQGFKFDEEDIKRVYAPIGHAQEYQQNQLIRYQLLQGNLELKTKLFPGNVEKSQEINDALLAVLKGEHPLKIEANSIL